MKLTIYQVDAFADKVFQGNPAAVCPPAAGVNEDAVTGSAHTTLTPYWANQMNKTELQAVQLSERSGKVHCRLLNDRVELAGKAVLYMKGEIFI